MKSSITFKAWVVPPVPSRMCGIVSFATAVAAQVLMFSIQERGDGRGRDNWDKWDDAFTRVISTGGVSLILYYLLRFEASLARPRARPPK